MAISMHLRVKIQYHMEGYIIIIYSEACNLQYQYMIVCNWGAWYWGWEEGSNGKHFSAIEGPGPGSVWGGGGGEMWKYFIAIEGMWKDFISK